MAKCFCLFCISPTQAVEKAGVGEQRLFSLRHLPNIPNLTKTDYKNCNICLSLFWGPMWETACYSLQKSLAHNYLAWEAAAFPAWEAFCSSHPAGTSRCNLPLAKRGTLLPVRHQPGNIFLWSDTHHPTCQAAAGNLAGNVSQRCCSHVLTTPCTG